MRYNNQKLKSNPDVLATDLKNSAEIVWGWFKLDLLLHNPLKTLREFQIACLCVEADLKVVDESRHELRIYIYPQLGVTPENHRKVLRGFWITSGWDGRCDFTSFKMQVTSECICWWFIHLSAFLSFLFKKLSTARKKRDEVHI